MFRTLFRRTRPATRAQRLCLLALEDRTVPAFNAWLGGNADWAADPAADWSLGRLPVATDDVRIANGATVTHGTNGTTGGDVTNSISVTGGSTLVLSGGSITVSTTLDDAGGSFQLSGGTLIGATVPAGSTIFGTGFDLGQLTGVTIAGTLDLQAASSILVVSGGLSLPGGLVRLGNAAGPTFGQLRFTGASQTVDGTAADPGTVLFGANQSNGLVANDTNASPVVTYGPNLTITGATGTISNTSSGGGFDLQGTVAADPAAVGLATGTITLDGTGWTNNGTILARNGGTIRAQGTTTNFSAGTLTGGTWKVFTNSTLRIVGGDITANAADIVLDGANSNFFSDSSGTTNALANFGTNAAAGIFTVQNGRNLTPAVAFANAGRVVVGDNSALTLNQGGTSTGDWDIAATGSLTFGGGTYLLDDGTDITGAGFATISGGTVSAGDAATDVINAADFAVATGTLTGAGRLNVTVALNWTGGTMMGSGTTNVANTATFTLRGSAAKTLQGWTLVNGGTATLTVGNLLLRDFAVFDNNGVFSVTDDADLVESNNANSQFRNDGTFNKGGTGTLTVLFGLPFDNTGLVNVASGTLQVERGGTSTAGTFAVSGGATLNFSNSYTLDAASSISGGGDGQFTGGVVTVNGSYALAGVTTVMFPGVVTFNAATDLDTLNLSSGTLGGSGNVTVGTALNWSSGNMTGSGTTTVADTATFTMSTSAFPGKTLQGRALVNDTTATLTGGNLLLRDFAVFDNNGVFTAADDADLIESNNGDSTFHNNGSFVKTGAGTSTAITSLSFTNTGTIDVQTGTLSLAGGLTNYSAGTGVLTGGTYHIAGTFQFPGAAVLTNAAAVTLDGPASAILNSATSADALANFATNAATGSFTLLNGRTLTAAGPFANAGSVTVDAAGGGSSFTATGAYTQTGGTTTLVAGGTLASTTNPVTIQGGTLRGTGTVTGDVTSSGTVAPGQSPGVMVITGDYTQDAGGTLGAEIGGTAAGTQYDQLQVFGTATLDGTLNVSLVNGFVPAVGDSFAVVTFASSTGDFATTTGLALGNACFLKERFDPTALNLDVILATLRYQTQPADTPAGQSFPVVVEVTDGSGNVLTSDNADRVTLTLNQNSFAGGVTFVTQPVVNGVATFNLTIDQGAAGYQLTAGGNGFAGVLSNTFFIGQAASFTSAGNTTFTAGTSGTFAVTADGAPTPALGEDVADVLPGGVTFTDNGDGAATLAGTPAAGSGGTYALHFTAHNGAGADATQLFTLTVDQAPAVTSAASTTFLENTPNTYTVRTTGFPIPALAESGALPGGVTFTDNGDGTATLAGTPDIGTTGDFGITIRAANGVGGDAIQSFTLTVSRTVQSPNITSADHTAFAVGSAGSFTVATAGAPTPRLSETGTLPGGVTFADNGDGTATLAGTPDAGTAGDYTLTVTASNGVDPNATQTFTLTVGAAPAITSADTATFAAGTAGTFTVTATGFPVPGLSETGVLPAGVAFVDNGDGTATLSGTPAAGTGRTYSLTVAAANGIGPGAGQSFTLTVNQPPTIASGPLPAALTTGTPVAFQATAAGFPAPSFSVAAGQLPPGLSLGPTGLVAGTPTAAGIFTGTLRAANAVGFADQPFGITVAAPAGGGPAGGGPAGGGAVDQGEVPQFAISGGPGVIPLNPDGSGFGPSVNPFGSTPARAVVADVTGDGTPDLVVGAGFGGSQVVVIDGATHQQVSTFTPFGSGFTGGTFVAAGDLNGDGRADIAVSADTGGGPRVVVFDGRTGDTLASFFAIADPSFRGGARVALGDLNGDGLADLAVAAGPGGGPRVALYDGATIRAGVVPASLMNDFFVFDPGLRDGAYLAIGDVTGDGFGDLIAGAGQGGSPRVLVISGQVLRAAGAAAAVGDPVASFFAAPAGIDGARVAAKDLDGDGFADVVVAVPADSGRKVLAFRGADLVATEQPPVFEDYSGTFDPLLRGVFVG